MAYATMLQNDFELRDDLQLVTFTNTVTGSTITSVKAKNRSLNFREVQLGGSLGFEPTDQVFMVGAKGLGAVVPGRGDKITTADGTKWTILSMDLYSFGDTPIYYNVVSRKQ